MIKYVEFRKQVIEKQTTCKKEAKEILDNISLNKNLNAYISISEKVLPTAEESDKRFSEGNPRKLEGMLIAVKDNISVAGMPTTAGSKMLQNYRSIYSATVISRIKEAGGIIIGKTNMDELAMGSSNETSYFGGVKNPVDLDYVPGGSSGGSAAAVAAGLAHVALGTDTGGSIRQPASFTGTIGFKPTYSSSSRAGVVALASSLDQVGTFSRSIEDTALLFDVMSGEDPADSTTTNSGNKIQSVSNTFQVLSEAIPNKFTVGILPEKTIRKCNDEVLKIYNSTLEKLSNLGAEFRAVEFIEPESWVPTYIILLATEASANLARLDGIRYGHNVFNSNNSNNFNNSNNIFGVDDYIAANRGEGFGEEVKRRVLLGTYLLTSNDSNKYYTKAKQIRQIVKNCYSDAFKNIDFMFLPTTATPAFKSDEKQSNPVQMYLSDFFTTSANLAGVPAISIPIGVSKNNLPIGMQLQTNHFEERKLFRFANALINY